MPKPTLLDRLLLRNCVASTRFLIVLGLGLALSDAWAALAAPNSWRCGWRNEVGFTLIVAGPLMRGWKQLGLDPFAERPLRALCRVLAWVAWGILLFRLAVVKETWDPTAPTLLLLVASAISVLGLAWQQRIALAVDERSDPDRLLATLSRFTTGLTAIFVLTIIAVLVFLRAHRYLDWPPDLVATGVLGPGLVASVAALTAAYSGAQLGPRRMRIRMALGEALKRLWWAAFAIYFLSIASRPPEHWGIWVGTAVGLFVLAVALALAVHRCLPEEEPTSHA